MSDADLVWNRACGSQANSSLREGDRALRDLLLVHGHVMNGGMTAAQDYTTEAQRRAAAAGYRYFGFEELAGLIESLAQSTESDREQAEARYYQIVQLDKVLVERFEAKFHSNREAFGPIER